MTIGDRGAGAGAHWMRPTPERVVVPDRLLAVLDEHHDLTLLSGPLGFGKSTLARLWAETRGALDGDVVTVDVSAARPWWAQVAAALEPTAPTRGATPTQVRAQLARRPDATTLVVDRLDAVLDEPLADQLLDLLDAVPRLSVVACLRDDVGPGPDLVGRLLSRGGRLVGATELVLTPSEVRDVLEVAGLRRGTDLAAELHAAVGGWPVLVRRAAAALLAGTGGVEGAAIVDRVVAEFVQHDLLPTMSAEAAATLCTSALPRHATVATSAAALGVGGPEAGSTLRRLGRWGVPRSEVVDGETVLRWPSALGEALRSALRHADPETVRDVDRRLAQWHHGRGEWRPAFEHAHDSGDAALVSAVLDKAWLPLIVYDVDVLVRYFRDAPAAAPEEQAFVHGVRDLALRLPRDPTADVIRFPADDADLARRACSPAVRATLNLGLVELFGLRRAHRVTEALELAEGLQELALAAHAEGSVDVADLLAPIFLLTGTLHELAGDPASAVLPLQWGVQTGAHSTLRGSLRHCSSHLAMDHALLGDGDEAETWLEHAAGTPEVAGWVRPRADIAVDVAGVLAAVGRLDHDAARARLRRLLTAVDPFDEMWPFALYARAQYALLWGDRSAVVQHVLTERASRPGWSATGSSLDTLLRAAEVDLLLALGHRDRAATAMRTAEPGLPLLDVARARLALLSGRPDAALSVARESLVSRPALTRVREDLTLIEVVARHRTGDTDRARGDLERILVEGTTSLRAFALVPDDDLRELTTDVPAALPVRRALDAAGVRAVFPVSLVPVRLTGREQVILQHLAVGLGRDQIAQRLSVSSHTVKSQTHSIYRKLGVSSRAGALAAAGEQGLLRAAPRATSGSDKDERTG